MNEQARACAAYFQSRPEYRRILSELLRKYRSYGRPAGTIRLDDATQEECDAARDIFGRSFSPPLRFRAAQFEAALQELRFGKVSLKEVLESYFDTEIRTNSEVREAENSRFSTIIAQILEQTDNRICIRWLQALKEPQGSGYKLSRREARTRRGQGVPYYRPVGAWTCWNSVGRAWSVWLSSVPRLPLILTPWIVEPCVEGCFCIFCPSVPVWRHRQMRSSGTACTMKTEFCATAFPAW